MPSIVLAGRPVAKKISDDVVMAVNNLKEQGVMPKLSIIRVGNKPEDISYELSALKRMDACGIQTETNILNEDISTDALLKIIETKNMDSSICGILIFQPLPSHINAERIRQSIHPLKDVDCIHPLSNANVYLQNKSALIPATPGAVMEIIRYYDIDLQGSNVAVLGRSMVVGKPLAMMLLNENATVTICHSKTKNIAEICRKADIIISCIGKAGFVTEEFVCGRSIVIDVGINLNKEGKICGDVAYDKVENIVSALTPVPGGVGAVTTSILARNIVYAAQYLNSINH
jgi:methylenetetrahydrofolate dehydrogenase (NADP+)/methenyltetrahydrofolate cyclohydrolase